MAFHLANVTVLTSGAPLRAGMELIIDDAGTITGLGRDLATPEGAERVDGGGALCLPGLVNSHNHSPLMIVRGMVEDRGFAPAYIPNVPQGHWLSDEESLALARLGVLEMLCAGATTIVDYYRCPEARVIFVTNTTFFSDGSIFAHSPNACAYVPAATRPEDLAAMVDYYAALR